MSISRALACKSHIRDAVKLLRKSGLDFDMVERSRHVQIYIGGTCVLSISTGTGRDYGRLESIIRQAKAGKPLKAEEVRRNHEESRL
jgi:hypothetical protein